MAYIPTEYVDDIRTQLKRIADSLEKLAALKLKEMERG